MIVRLSKYRILLHPQDAEFLLETSGNLLIWARRGVKADKLPQEHWRYALEGKLMWSRINNGQRVRVANPALEAEMKSLVVINPLRAHEVRPVHVLEYLEAVDIVSVPEEF